MQAIDLPASWMRRALLAFGSESASEDRHASKCSASRIRRRSRQHLIESYALGGPMKDRLRRWLTPVVIDCTRRGTHDRADVTEPCRGCATAVSCRAASRTSRRPCPRPVCYGAHCTSVAQTCRAARRVTRQLLPRSPTDVPAPSGQRRRRTYPDNCYKRQAEAVRGGDLDQIAAITNATHANMPPAAAFPTQACCCLRDASIPYAFYNEHAACGLTSRRE